MIHDEPCVPFRFWALDHCTASALPLVSAFGPNLFFSLLSCSRNCDTYGPHGKGLWTFQAKNLIMCLRRILENRQQFVLKRTSLVLLPKLRAGGCDTGKISRHPL